MKSMTLKRKFVMTFAFLIIIVSICISTLSVIVFNKVYKKKSYQFIMDIENQTTNNLEEKIAKIESITFELLKNSVVQSQLIKVNQNTLSDYKMTILKKNIENELAVHALFNDKIVSLSIFSLKGNEFTIQPTIGQEVKQMFSPEEIFEAKGSTLWGVSDDGENNICVARAIIGLNSQKPIGYINIVLKESYFGNIIHDIAGTYTSGAYIVCNDEVVKSSNNKTMLGKKFPLSNIESENNTLLTEKIQGIKSYVYIGDVMENGWRLIVTVPVNEISKDILSLIGFVFLIADIAIIVSVFLIFILVKKLLDPLETLKESMKIVGKGSFSSRVENSSTDEIGQLSETFNNMADNIQTLIEKVYKMEIAQSQAEIEFLKMQINPHFLYNTLDTINWMARMKDNHDIAEVTTTLADLLRATIKQESMITIGEELRNVRNYIFIQEYRFGDKFSVEYEIDHNALEYVIPNFILQPFVENAIIHGIEPKLSHGLFKIKINKNDNKISFEISDNGIGMSSEKINKILKQCSDENSKQSIGIKNVYRRLKICYKAEGTLKIDSHIGKGTTISFFIEIDNLTKNR